MAENSGREQHETTGPPLPEIPPPELRHEQTDVNVWAVGKFAIALVLVCIAALALLAGLLKFFVNRETAGNQPISPGVNVDARRLPPEPRLQTAPVLDLDEMRAAEDKILNGYGWVDAGRGLARIPIGRAMDLLAQRGLPARPQSGPQTASDAVVPTASGLGPIVQQPGGPLAAWPAAEPPQARNAGR